MCGVTFRKIHYALFTYFVFIFPFQSALAQFKPGNNVWTLGAYLGYQDYLIHKQGEETGALLQDSLGVAGGNFHLFGSGTGSRLGLVSLFSVGVHEASLEKFDSANGYTKRGVSRVREGFALFSPALAWIAESRVDATRYIFFVGPSIERLHFEVDAYLAEAPDRSEACGQAVNDRSGIAMKEHCEHVRQSSNVTSYSTQMGFVVLLDDHIFYYFAFQSLSTYVSTKQGGYEMVRTPKPVVSMQHIF